jgi:hypothetical protein
MQIRLAWIAPVVLVAASALADEVYRYTDEHGRTHWTDSYYEVPERYRDQLEQVGEAEGRGRVSVVPGFMAPPEPKGKDGKGKPGAKKEQPGFASGFEAAFSRHFESATGRAPSSLGAGLLIFMILVAIAVALAIGAGFLKTACNIAGERPLALGHAMLIVLIQGIAGALASGALNLTLAIAGQPGPTLALIGALGGFAATVTVNAGVLKGMHCETWGMALKVTFIVMLLGLVVAAPMVYCALR